MRLKEFNVVRNIWQALKEFFKEEGLDKCSILAYYSISSSLFLLTFFTFLFTRFLGDPDFTIKNIYPFSPEFFSSISPDIFKKAAEISMRLKDIGVIGILFSFIFGFLLIKKIVQFVNAMFHIDLRAKRSDKHFLVRRVSEFGLLFIIGLLVIATFFMTGFISTITSLSNNNEFIATHIKPEFISAINNFMLVYMVPLVVTFLFFFVLYKWIPEKAVYVKGAFIAAIISSLVWELTKRGYAYYMVNISIFGKIKGPIIAIILFGFWMELSMGIMLYGAKLTHIFDKQKMDKDKLNALEAEAAGADENKGDTSADFSGSSVKKKKKKHAGKKPLVPVEAKG
ncbi:MAG: YihY/virulence factor BrkB family protein [bacterium]|nr:YihY/virulence factor BrkB family protein [bacterium]